MKSINELEREVWSLITIATEQKNTENIAELNLIAKRIEKVNNDIIRIERELNGFINNELPPEGNGEGIAKKTKIKVTIHWQKAGKNISPEVIEEGAASRTLVKVIERLARVYGQDILEKLSHLRVNRGFLITCNPNKKYKHHPLNGFFVLTNSSTDEKKVILEKISSFLSLPENFFIVEVIEK